MVKKNKKDSNMNKSAGPGIGLEKVVARIQQMMDPNSTVTHNEVLEDRVGNRRQYDIVIRGQFGGRPVLGVMECKDHNRKKGPETVEAFSKKTENLGANLRIIVSRSGFTKQALKLAKHENIGCLSLLPEDSAQVGFSIGDMRYGVVRMWVDVRLIVHFAVSPAPIGAFDSKTIKWDKKQVGLWFLRELFTTRSAETVEGEHTITVKFKEARNIEIEGKEYPVIGLSCVATRICRNKKKWVSWSGDAFYDWHTGKFTVPPNGTIVGSAIETDWSVWPDFDGKLPDFSNKSYPGFMHAIIHFNQKWDISQDPEVPDLNVL